MEQAELLTLIEKCKQGDQAAQEKLVVETQNKVYYHCKKFLKNEDDAQDATQDVLVTMLTSLDKLRQPAAFWGWLNGITANRCKHMLTQGTKEWQIPEDEEGNSMLDSMETLDDQTVPDKVIDTAETQRLILDIIDGLPAEQKMTVTFFYYDEMSVKAIAQAMEVSEGTVKSRLNYARKSIKDEVEKLAKQGTKLYGISPLPFLAYFLRMGAQSQVLSPSAATAITQGTLAASGGTAAAAGTTATATAGTATAAAGTKVAGVAATKIVAVALAGTLTVGGIGTGVYVATHQEPEASVPPASPPAATEVSFFNANQLPLPQELEPLLEELIALRDAEDLPGLAAQLPGEEFQAAIVSLEPERVYEGDFSRQSGDVFRLYPKDYGYLGGWEQGQRSGRGLWFHTTVQASGAQYLSLYLGNWAGDLPNGQGTNVIIRYGDEGPHYDVHQGSFTDGLYDGTFQRTYFSDPAEVETARETYVNGFVQPVEALPADLVSSSWFQEDLAQGECVSSIGDKGRVFMEQRDQVHGVPNAHADRAEAPTATATPPPEPTDPPIPAICGQAYGPKVLELSQTLGDGARYGLAYINEDDIPELTVSQGSDNGEWRFISVYSITPEGKLCDTAELASGLRSNVFYYPGANIVKESGVSSPTTGATAASYSRMNDSGRLEEFFSSTGENLEEPASPPEVEGLQPAGLEGSLTAQEMLDLLGYAPDSPEPTPAADPDFTIENGVLVKYNGPGGDVTVPDGVTAIGKAAFTNARATLTGVTLPEGLTSIGTSAFLGCLLTRVSLPSSLTSIGDAAFLSCRALTDIALPDGLTTIDERAFYHSGLSAITIPDSVTSIGESAFQGTALTDIVIPDSVTTMGSGTFSYCQNLSRVTIGKGLTRIEPGTFYACPSLTEITIPENITSMGSNVFFDGTISLAKATILNPAVDLDGTFYRASESNPNLTLYAPAGSTTEKYAQIYNIPFVALDG